jgi:Tfp pilus assembly protein PilV
MILMLRRTNLAIRFSQRGDTLIEVTFALAILSMVLLGSTAIAASSFRMGQTARERTTISQAAQEQMEALRSFRDNNKWSVFEAAIEAASAGGSSSFHMETRTSGVTTEWVPVNGQLDASTTNSTSMVVPTSTIDITTNTPSNLKGCGYDFLLTYKFTPLGGGVAASNQIQTRLANLNFNWDVATQGAAPCLP